jgi:23S rRNA (guanosine2251-2'-O)-methyltransferase
MRKLDMNELNRLDAEGFKNSEKNNFCIILDNVRSLNNVGSAFRTGDAFLVDKIYLCGITGTPPDREINKTALGATDTVDWEHHPNTIDLVKALKKEGWKIYAIEQVEPKIYLQDFKPNADDKYAFIFGNEVQGVDEDLLPLCEGSIEIPQFGSKHSLNIAVTIGIVTWDYISKVNIL